MSGDRRYFKLWAAEALLSDDLDALSDHERTVWLFAMCAASLEEPRWTVAINKRLALKCKTSEARLVLALNHMVDLGIVTLRDKCATFVNAHRWNEETERKAPSSSREGQAARQQAKRDRDKAASQRDVTASSHVTRHDHKEEEQEEEKEQEEKSVTETVTAAAAARCCRLWEEETGTSMPRATWDRMETWIEKAGEPWVQDAIRETGKGGAKSWKYTDTILDRWWREGRDVPKPTKQAANDGYYAGPPIKLGSWGAGYVNGELAE